jgi:hypothetical protein
MMAAKKTNSTTGAIPATPTLYVGVVIVATVVFIPGIKDREIMIPIAPMINFLIADIIFKNLQPLFELTIKITHY